MNNNIEETIFVGANNSALCNLSLDDKLKFAFNIEFISQLLNRRKELGWTQSELAERSGVNRITISKIERFQRMASIEVILKLAYAVGLAVKFCTITPEET